MVVGPREVYKAIRCLTRTITTRKVTGRTKIPRKCMRNDQRGNNQASKRRRKKEAKGEIEAKKE